MERVYKTNNKLMKFLALVATCAALSLGSTAQSPDDIVKYFLDKGSADAVMTDLDANSDGKITLAEVNKKVAEMGADAADKRVAKWLFHSISKGGDVINKRQLKFWEAGVKLLLKNGCSQ